MKIGIIKEGKTPPDSRVPLTPKQCATIIKKYPVELVVASSPTRSYQDEEYSKEHVPLSQNLSDSDLLLGVKEVPIEQLIPNKTYCFFSHTIKKQAYNRKLLQAILEKNIRLIDYEVLTDEKGKRLIAFGKFAGMVGAHNCLWTYGQRTKAFQMKRMKDCHDYAEAQAIYKTLQLPAIKIVLTGGGRVGNGAAMVLDDMGIKKVSPEDFLKKEFREAVYTQLNCIDYAAPKDGSPFDKNDFYDNPHLYKSIFQPFTAVADAMINGIFWDSEAPVFFTNEDMNKPDFNIQVIADVTCDIAPVTSIPSTLRPSTIANPVFGYDPKTSKETEPFQQDSIDMMTIDNLPNELPRDASEAFGNQFLEHILLEFLKEESSILERATIAENGHLGKHFQYLENYVGGSVAI